MQVKRKHLDYLYLGFFIFVLVSFFTGILVSSSGYSMVVIDNADPNSMWPTYFQGDLFVLQDANPEDIGLGDVVVYKDSDDQKIIHRVIDIVFISDQYYFRVKGDNPISNPNPDEDKSTLINSDSILGKIIFRIPYLGHLSLAMQENEDILQFVYFIAALLGIAIVFWPEDDEEEEKKEEFIDINKSSTKALIVTIIAFPIIILLRIKNSQHRLLHSFGFMILIFLIILPAFIPSFVTIASTPNGIGVLEINSSRTIQYNESINGQSLDYSFTQVEITLYDNEGFWSRIKGFTLTAFTLENDPNSLISTMKWISLRDFKGIITIGASLVIDRDDQPSEGSTIFLVVTLNWVEIFTENSKEYHTELVLFN